VVKDLTFVTVEGGPHNIGWTFPEAGRPGWGRRRGIFARSV